MEKEDWKGGWSRKSSEQEFLVQWGKRIQRVRLKHKHPPSQSQFSRVGDGARKAKSSSSSSPSEKERCYTTRGWAAATVGGEDKENVDAAAAAAAGGGGVRGDDKGKQHQQQHQQLVWPKLYISLSSKEKEEDFLAMKGCKLPQRPKKRAKFIQRTLLLVSPGAWLTDMCQERYEVREKKTPKKRPRGLKAMGSIVDSDTE